MKHVLLHLSLLLAFGALAGDWQFVAEIPSFESSITKSEQGTLDNSGLDETEFAVLTSIDEQLKATVSGPLDSLSLLVNSSPQRNVNSIRAPPVSRS